MTADAMTNELEHKYQRLKEIVAGYTSAVVAFSGGIDSSLVAYVAGQVLGDRALAVTSGSASLKRTDLALSKKLSDDWGIAHQIIVTDELSKADYRANPTNRCFHCKTSFQMVEAQMDFLLYCFDKWMSDRPQDKENGFKSNTWQGVYKQTLQDMFDTYPFNN